MSNLPINISNQYINHSLIHLSFCINHIIAEANVPSTANKNTASEKISEIQDEVSRLNVTADQLETAQKKLTSHAEQLKQVQITYQKVIYIFIQYNTILYYIILYNTKHYISNSTIVFSIYIYSMSILPYPYPNPLLFVCLLFVSFVSSIRTKICWKQVWWNCNKEYP